MSTVQNKPTKKELARAALEKLRKEREERNTQEAWRLGWEYVGPYGTHTNNALAVLYAQFERMRFWHTILITLGHLGPGSTIRHGQTDYNYEAARQMYTQAAFLARLAGLKVERNKKAAKRQHLKLANKYAAEGRELTPYMRELLAEEQERAQAKARAEAPDTDEE